MKHIIARIIETANQMDSHGFYKEATQMDNIAKRIAQTQALSIWDCPHDEVETIDQMSDSPLYSEYKGRCLDCSAPMTMLQARGGETIKPWTIDEGYLESEDLEIWNQKEKAKELAYQKRQDEEEDEQQWKRDLAQDTM